MISRRARIVRWISGRYIRRIDVRNADVDKMRRRLDWLGRLSMKAFRVKLEKTTVHGLYAEWLRPKNAVEGKVLLYLHGGGYVIGSCRSHRQLVSHIARAARIDALVPEYRLSPESKFPCAIEDALGVYRELLASGTKASDIIIAGDSAGGGLTVSTLLSLRHAGDPMPAAAVLLSPFLDLSVSGETMQTRADRDPWFDREKVAAVADYYCSDESEITKPLVSPVFANVAGMPPTYIQVGDDEVLLSDSTRLADKLESTDGQVRIEVFPELWHVFQLFVGKMPESRAAIKKIGEYVGSLLPPASEA